MNSEPQSRTSSTIAVLLAAPFIAMAAIPIAMGAVMFLPVIVVFALLHDLLGHDKT